MKSFCISLEKNKDSWNEVLKRIRGAGFEDVEIFPGIKGTDVKKVFLDEPAPEDISIIVDNFGGVRNMISAWGKYTLLHSPSDRRHGAQLTGWGSIGCYLSHALIWLRMIEENMPYCVIFEDDVRFANNFSQTFNERIREVPEDADAIFLGVSQNFKPIRYNRYINQIGAVFYGLHAYIMTNKGARKFLKNAFPIEVQVDSNMSFVSVLNKMKLYDIPGLCWQSFHPSSIQVQCFMCGVDEKKVRAMFLILAVAFFVFIAIVFMSTQSHQTQV
jgi:GR25 family glycosyltransferase involved in LPS biosynthesis